MPKKRRVWKKIELIETSAVGTPSYPDAHLSYSFIKALNAQLNLKETEMAEENEVQETETSEAPAETSETSESEEKEETENSESESEKSEDSAEKSAEIKELIDKSVNEALIKAIKELSPQRGLVAKKEELQKMSLGELAIKSGLFKA